MRGALKILAVAGVFCVSVCAVDADTQNAELGNGGESLYTWSPEEVGDWKWSQEELADGLDVIHRYAEDEVNKVSDAYCRSLKMGSFRVFREDFEAELGAEAFRELENGAGDSETQFALRFAADPFMAFLVVWDYFRWRKCSDKKYRLFPSRGPLRQTLRNLYNEFKSGDFAGKDLRSDRKNRGQKRSEVFEANLRKGEEYRQQLNGAD